MDKLFDFILERRRLTILLTVTLMLTLTVNIIQLIFDKNQLSGFQYAYIGMMTNAVISWPIWRILIFYYEEIETRQKIDKFLASDEHRNMVTRLAIKQLSDAQKKREGTE